eukprot:3933423-Prymnesium_polylepis.1
MSVLSNSSIAVEYDVLIIGAGMAGVSAAAELHRYGVKRFAVLEASNRTGGRVKSFTFGDPSVSRVVLENGANWVSGAPRRGKYGNILYHLAVEHRLQMHRVPGSATNMSNWEVFDSEGRRTDLDGARRARANSVFSCVNQSTHSTAGSNMTVEHALKACGWAARDGVDAALLWQLFSGESGMVPAAMSLAGTLPEPTYAWFGPDDYFVFDQAPRGFASMVDAVGGRVRAATTRATALHAALTTLHLAHLQPA